MKKISVVLVCLILTIGTYAYAGAHGILTPFWKVTDPSDPRFNPDDFCFCDYTMGTEMSETFKMLFPVGTTKEFVDRILVNAGRAKNYKEKNYDSLWFYTEPTDFLKAIQGLQWKGTPRHMFVFDDKNHVVNIHAHQGIKLFPSQPSYSDLDAKGKSHE